MKVKIKRAFKKLKIYTEIKFLFLKLKEVIFRVIFKNEILKKVYIKKRLLKSTGYKIDFKKGPQTFSEKIQFRKLYEYNELFSICADKYKVREYVKDKIGENYLIPLILVTDKLTDDQWNILPEKFVAKANHNSGPVQIIKDKNKVNKKDIINELNNQLKLDYGILSMEKYYSKISRKIIVEKYLENNGDVDLRDYKFFCFHGEPLFCQLIKNRSLDEVIDFYDMNWKKMEFTGLTTHKKSLVNDLKPKNFEKMKEIVTILSKDFNFVRVDLYNIEGKIYFGELTFCPASGFGKFIPDEWNYKFLTYWENDRRVNKK